MVLELSFLPNYRFQVVRCPIRSPAPNRQLVHLGCGHSEVRYDRQVVARQRLCLQFCRSWLTNRNDCAGLTGSVPTTPVTVKALAPAPMRPADRREDRQDLRCY
jgi:hypothetical protein